jgi:uncharacterized protein (TIGR01777 family)
MGGEIMRVIIAGGSGLIGTELTSQLTQSGDEVTILSRNPQKVSSLPEGAKTAFWDGKTLQDWGQYIENSDAIINLTGENLSGQGMLPNRWTEERKTLLLKSRVDSGLVLTQAVQKAHRKPSVFIQASGVGYYGTRQQKPLTEIDGPGDDFLANLSKEWEASSLAIESLGVRRIVIRNGVVLSTTGGALPFMLLPYKLFIGGPLGNGRQVYSWIHLKDEASAISFLLKDQQAHGIYNLTSPKPATNDEFGRTIARLMGRPHYFRVPGFAMHLLLGEVASMVLEGQRVLPQKLIDAGFEFKFPSLEQALKDLLSS